MDRQRVAMVTGASSGIGAATVRALAGRGWAVVATARRGDRLAKLAAEGGDVLAAPGDITDPGLTDALFAAAIARWRRPVDTFVHCAGIGLPGSLLGSDEARWRELYEVNVLAAARQLRAAAAALRRAWAPDVEHTEAYHDTRSAGTVRDIVVVGSTVGRQVSPANPVYGSTKFALHGITEGLRQEVCGEGIRTTLIEPGFVRSEFQETAGYDMGWFGEVEREYGPLLAPDDVARTILFVVEQPPHVHLDTVRIRPTRQKL